MLRMIKLTKDRCSGIAYTRNWRQRSSIGDRESLRLWELKGREEWETWRKLTCFDNWPKESCLWQEEEDDRHIGNRWETSRIIEAELALHSVDMVSSACGDGVEISALPLGLWPKPRGHIRASSVGLVSTVEFSKVEILEAEYLRVCFWGLTRQTIGPVESNAIQNQIF